MATAPIPAPESWARRLLAALPLRLPAPADPPWVLARKLEALHARLPVGIVMAALVSAFVVVLMPVPGGRGPLLAWGAASVAVAVLRMADCVTYPRRPQDPAGTRRSRSLVVAGALAQALLWGILGGLLFPAEPLPQFFVLVILTGMAGGGMAFLPLLNGLYPAFATVLLVPVSLRLLGGTLPIQRGVGLLALLYLLALLMASTKTTRWISDALGAAFEREELVARLQASRDRLEEQKAHLEQVVAGRTVSLSDAVARLREGLREKEQERLRAARSDARHLSLLESINEGFGHVDEQEEFLYANPAAEKILGVAPGTLAGRNLLEFLDPDGAARIRQETEQRRQGRVSRYQVPVIRGDGQRRLLQVAASPVFAEDGRFSGTSAVFEDVTERTQAEHDLRAALVFNGQIIASAHQGIIVYDPQGRYRLWNPFMEALTGVPADAVLGRRPDEVLEFPAIGAIMAGIGRALQGQSVTLPPFPWSVPGTGRSGWASSILAPMRDGGGGVTGVVETVTDLTEWKRVEQRQRDLEAELHHAQKLESIGSLAGGVAHDMNNVLAAVQAIVQTLRDKHPGQAGLQADLGLIERASTRGRDLVKALTNFVRKELEEPERLDLNALVGEEVELLGHTTLQRVALVVDLAEDLPPVLGERGALGGALMNLCVNALDAMPEKGTLTLRTRRLEDGQVQVLVEDTGKGMAPEVLARALEPFFTTKEAGKGTGLGLASVYATLKAHGGTVALRSAPGRGTTVDLRLPAAEGAPAPAPQAAAPAPAPGALRILQVDDDELILASVPRMLEQGGHQVVTAWSGREALERLGAGLEVDVVVLDLNMPGMNGLETLERIRVLRPDLPVLLATGFLEPGAEDLLRRCGRALSIAKPFSMAELVTMLRRVTRPEGAA